MIAPSVRPSGIATFAAGLAALMVAAPLTAQEHDHQEHATPYAGLESRAIKALSDDEVGGLLAGEGMGLALAAELNGWPGPRHVLELAADLGLTENQRVLVEAIQDRMLTRARELGARVVEQEQALDRRFAHGHVDQDVLDTLTGEIGRLQGELRAVHLGAHLETRAVLDEEQRQAYQRLRGYAPGEGGTPGR